MLKKKKDVDLLKEEIEHLHKHIETLSNKVYLLELSTKFLYQHDKENIALSKQGQYIKVSYCGRNGFGVTIFSDAYVLEHLDNCNIETIANDIDHTIFSVDGVRIFRLNKNCNTIADITDYKAGYEELLQPDQ